MDLQEKMLKICKKNPEILIVIGAKKNWKGDIETAKIDRFHELMVCELPMVLNLLEPLVKEMRESYDATMNKSGKEDKGTINKMTIPK